MLGAREIDPNIEGNLPQGNRRRLRENFDAVVLAVSREKAARRDEKRPHNQVDQPRGRVAQSPEHPTNDRTQGQQHHQWATRPFIVRGIYGLLGCSAAGHSVDAPGVGFLNLGLLNPASLLC